MKLIHKFALSLIAAVSVSAMASAGQEPAPPPPAQIQVSPDLVVRELANGVWMHTSFRVLPGGMRYPSNGLIVREGDGLVLIDTAWGEALTRELLAWIDRGLKLPVTRAIVTHAHDDRMGGAPVLAERNIPILGSRLTGPLARKQGWPEPLPIEGLGESGSAVQTGSLEVFYPGPAHTVDNLTVWIPSARILFGGCAVKDAASRTLGNIAGADVPAWPAAIERLQQRYGGQAAIVVPGHGEPGDAGMLASTLRLARSAAKAAP